jgi:hypothetical protein
MTYLLALIAGVLGAAAGWACAAAATIYIGGLMGVSNFEGGLGMLAIWGIGPIGGLVGLVTGIALALRWRGGFSGRGIAWRLPLVVAAIAALAAGGLWWMYEARPVLNDNGPAPRLAFELRLPPGVAAPARTAGATVELHTERNRMPGRIVGEPARAEDGRTVLAGDVEVYYRSGWRLLELKVPGQSDRLFRLDLPASPRRTTDFGRWERAQYVVAPGDTQPRKTGPDESFEIRYRMIWPE